jgi:Uma2 family endonuclease
VAEYRQLAGAGVLNENDRVELLEGWIVPKMIHNPPHDSAIESVDHALRSHVPEGWRLRIQSAITTDDSEPEPDIAIVRGSIRQHAAQHPGPSDIGLLVEVADTSLERDRMKCGLYARAGIPVYWIVNLVESKVEVYSDPSGRVDQPRYGQRHDYGFDDSVPLIIEGRHLALIAVHHLLIAES